MTDKNRRFLVTGTAAGLASTLLAGVMSRPALAWTDQDFAPVRRRRSRDPVPADDGTFYDTRGQDPRGQATDPYYRGGPAPAEAPEEDSFWGGRRAVAPPQPGNVDPNAAIVVDDGPIDYARAYAAVETEPFPVPAFRWRRANPSFLRQEVAYGGRYAPGTIVVDPRAHHLYLIQEGGRARRYGVGVGRQGFAWNGAATINSKQAWPDWYPPKEMIARQPALARSVSKLQSGLGVPGGSHNPLGARALYLWQNNKDTLYRIHGTTEPESIGRSVSSGCIRMINQDAIDLYARVPVGAQVVVLG
ncbi:L,D-transpeptidase [Methylobacterium currus]|uniref:L,D-transpeptidase n=1 Tax=Methylobacterium currus TaxID=2051553 RepID=A0A2R4WGA8_9HYPH|nr:L,D-transpeptidase [Methylobacterium currus]AWB20559.1 L,D-transpeptidase [Methylobacterium currus]UHC14681.1 L,D-transpeptidase [Methylobacterium currus]